MSTNLSKDIGSLSLQDETPLSLLSGPLEPGVAATFTTVANSLGLAQLPWFMPLDILEIHSTNECHRKLLQRQLFQSHREAGAWVADPSCKENRVSLLLCSILTQTLLVFLEGDAAIDRYPCDAFRLPNGYIKFSASLSDTLTKLRDWPSTVLEKALCAMETERKKHGKGPVDRLYANILANIVIAAMGLQYLMEGVDLPEYWDDVANIPGLNPTDVLEYKSQYGINPVNTSHPMMTWAVPMGVGSVYGWSPMRGNRALSSKPGPSKPRPTASPAHNGTPPPAADLPMDVDGDGQPPLENPQEGGKANANEENGPDGGQDGHRSITPPSAADLPMRVDSPTAEQSGNQNNDGDNSDADVRRNDTLGPQQDTRAVDNSSDNDIDVQNHPVEPSADEASEPSGVDDDEDRDTSGAGCSGGDSNSTPLRIIIPPQKLKREQSPAIKPESGHSKRTWSTTFKPSGLSSPPHRRTTRLRFSTIQSQSQLSPRRQIQQLHHSLTQVG
ncbi:hypothetical protein PLEOSDRAFT_1101253 [Pleurotus ostreatus PC15]|uniref:Uncharacterized protein n=1 Tax=Pleurotus ostreatus (strain PC15) TaxID=1137138 RepID=A0A067NQA6_PLEO1|nr:hypothetical protein PLEOSDRAFT_1101253 [Pleurotus ostreatus PC15]